MNVSTEKSLRQRVMVMSDRRSFYLQVGTIYWKCCLLTARKNVSSGKQYKFLSAAQALWHIMLINLLLVYNFHVFKYYSKLFVRA